VDLCEEVQKNMLFFLFNVMFKKIYVGSNSFALQNGLSLLQLVIDWK
jgi:hypothetical protein